MWFEHRPQTRTHKTKLSTGRDTTKCKTAHNRILSSVIGGFLFTCTLGDLLFFLLYVFMSTGLCLWLFNKEPDTLTQLFIFGTDDSPPRRRRRTLTLSHLTLPLLPGPWTPIITLPTLQLHLIQALFLAQKSFQLIIPACWILLLLCFVDVDIFARWRMLHFCHSGSFAHFSDSAVDLGLPGLFRRFSWCQLQRSDSFASVSLRGNLSFLTLITARLFVCREPGDCQRVLHRAKCLCLRSC